MIEEGQLLHLLIKDRSITRRCTGQKPQVDFLPGSAVVRGYICLRLLPVLSAVSAGELYVIWTEK